VRGSEIAADLSQNLATRGAQIVAAVSAGQYVPPSFTTLVLQGAAGGTLEVQVMDDALQLGEESDFFRPNVNYNDHETIAALLGLVMLTPKVADARFAAGAKWQATTMEPLTSNAQMLAHSEMVSERAAQAGAAPGELYGQSGKLWVSSSRLDAKKYADGWAVNYGFYTWPPAAPEPVGTPGPKPAETSLAGTTVWQEPGMAHNRNHVDYSQVFVAMQPTGVLRLPGETPCAVELAAVAMDPATFGLIATAPTTIRPAQGADERGLTCAAPPPGTPKKKNNGGEGARGLVALAALAALLALLARHRKARR
jgi:hypothetical protein